MAIENGQQIKVVYPERLYLLLEAEAVATGVPIASIVRVATVEYYRQKGMLKIGVADVATVANDGVPADLVGDGQGHQVDQVG
jgi:hypothetical protein